MTASDATNASAHAEDAYTSNRTHTSTPPSGCSKLSQVPGAVGRAASRGLTDARMVSTCAA